MQILNRNKTLISQNTGFYKITSIITWINPLELREDNDNALSYSGNKNDSSIKNNSSSSRHANSVPLNR